jgi:hypothetical protein
LIRQIDNCARGSTFSKEKGSKSRPKPYTLARGPKNRVIFTRAKRTELLRETGRRDRDIIVTRAVIELVFAEFPGVLQIRFVVVPALKPYRAPSLPFEYLASGARARKFPGWSVITA